MIDMRNKCDNSISAAYYLASSEDERNWSASVHCSYYGVFQYMKFLLANKVNPPITYSQQDAQHGDSSHKYIRREIINRISTKNEADKLDQRIKDLHQQRILADYTDTQFTKTESIGCHDEADAIVRTLHSLFK